MSATIWEAPKPLPRGRHNLSAEEVRASQRERLLHAMLICVGEHGYAATTVPQVVATARVSRNGFYALFRDKVECFLALCDQLAEEILSLLYGFGSGPDWEVAVDRGMAAYLRWWQDRPAFARAYLVELPSAGPRAVAQREAALREFKAMFAALAFLAGTRPSDLSLRVLVAGIMELIAEEVRAGRLETLDSLHGELSATVKATLTARPRDDLNAG